METLGGLEWVLRVTSPINNPLDAGLESRKSLS